MNDEYIYKSLYEAAQEDTKDTNNAFMQYFDKQSKEDLGDRYYEYKDYIMVEELKDVLSYLEKPDWDIYETPDNKARDISAIYRVLEYYMTYKDYQEFVKGRRDAVLIEAHAKIVEDFDNLISTSSGVDFDFHIDLVTVWDKWVTDGGLYNVKTEEGH